MTDELVARATEARELARADYSNFKVGAALRTHGGKIYTGCNVESASFGLTMCAERVALLKALSEGESAFAEIAIVTDSQTLTPPCGACRQLLWEYCGDIPVHIRSLTGAGRTTRLAELLPEPFDGTNLTRYRGPR